MPQVASGADRSPDTIDQSLRIGAKRQPFGLFPAASPQLLVPPPNMWFVHESSKPTAIASRLGIFRGSFDNWGRIYRDRVPWLPKWLYGEEPPADADMSLITDGMRAFRAKTQITAIAEETPRPAKEAWVGCRPRKRNHVTVEEIRLWRNQCREAYPDQGWIDDWLLRGQEPPQGITVITPDQARRCAKAWDYVGLCQSAEIGSYLNNYYVWLTRPPKTVPDGDDRLAWLKWLYSNSSYRRAPAYIVTPELQDYRRRCSMMGTAALAGVSLAAVNGWRRDPVERKLLREAMNAARKQREPSSLAFMTLDRRMRVCMCRYAKSSTQSARCKGIFEPKEFYRLVRLAEDRGVKRDLTDYLSYKGDYKAISLRKQQGLINGKLFVLPEPMRAFHEAAVKEWTKQKIAELEQVAGFWEWFVAWVTPTKAEPQSRVQPSSDFEEAVEPVPVAAVNQLGPPAPRRRKSVEADRYDPRPAVPTADYCLLPPNTLRWIGETELQPRLYALLDWLLKAKRWPVSFDSVEHIVGDNSKRVSTEISRLNTALEKVIFPTEFGTKMCHITKR
jgi:hypothetical protein